MAALVEISGFVITKIILFLVSKWSNDDSKAKADKNGEVSNWRNVFRKTVCQSVRYYIDKCCEEYRKKRKAELHDKKLFSQPDSTHHGECPICFLPMPLDTSKSTFWPCCSKIICEGCDYESYKSNIHDRAFSCPFCREPVASKKENRIRMMKRVKANDPAAMKEMGLKCYGEGDYKGAFIYWTEAAKLGDFDSHHHLGVMYREGQFVEKDMEKAIYHWEKAAIGGHPDARYSLSYFEQKNGNTERAVKHAIIAANLGKEDSMKELWGHYAKGNMTKEELEATLRSHKAAIDEMRSSQREEAERWEEERFKH